MIGVGLSIAMIILIGFWAQYIRTIETFIIILIVYAIITLGVAILWIVFGARLRASLLRDTSKVGQKNQQKFRKASLYTLNIPNLVLKIYRSSSYWSIWAPACWSWRDFSRVWWALLARVSYQTESYLNRYNSSLNSIRSSSCCYSRTTRRARPRRKWADPRLPEPPRSRSRILRWNLREKIFNRNKTFIVMTHRVAATASFFARSVLFWN